MKEVNCTALSSEVVEAIYNKSDLSLAAKGLFILLSYPLKEGYVGTSKDSKITSKQYDPAELARDESGNLKVF